MVTDSPTYYEVLQYYQTFFVFAATQKDLFRKEKSFFYLFLTPALLDGVEVTLKFERLAASRWVVKLGIS